MALSGVILAFAVVELLFLVALTLVVRGEKRFTELAKTVSGQRENALLLAEWCARADRKISSLESQCDDVVELSSTSCDSIGADFHVIAAQFSELGASVYGVGNNLRVVANRFQGRRGDAFPGEEELGPDDFTVNQASGQRCCARENG